MSDLDVRSGEDSADFDQTQAEAIDRLRASGAFVALTIGKAGVDARILVGTDRNAFDLAALILASLPDVVAAARVAAELIPVQGARDRALADVERWERAAP